MDHARRMRLIEAVLWLAVARAALIFVPFPRIARHLGVVVVPSDAPPCRSLAEPPQQRAAFINEVGWAVTRAARYLPFKAVCLPQAIAARQMLNRRCIGSVLHFGVARRNDVHRTLQAHAWLDAAGIEVTGYGVAGEFKEIASFVSAPLCGARGGGR